MTSGVIYLMTTAVRGLVKIGKCETPRYELRMKELENNGYFNVAGLKRLFAIEVEGYSSKEKMLHELFEKARLSNSELFAIDKALVVELLSSFEGEQIYPSNKTKEEVFDSAANKVSQAIEKKVKQRYYGVSLEKLIDEGYLTEGELVTMVYARYPGTGIIRLEGIEVNGEVLTVSASALECMKEVDPNKKATNGWEAWGFHREEGLVKLKDLRDEHISNNH